MSPCQAAPIPLLVSATVTSYFARLAPPSLTPPSLTPLLIFTIVTPYAGVGSNKKLAKIDAALALLKMVDVTKLTPKVKERTVKRGKRKSCNNNLEVNPPPNYDGSVK